MKKNNPSNQQLTIRMHGYIASAGALLALGTQSKAEVVYSGIQNIELNFPGEFSYINLNDDSDYDFLIYINGFYNSGTYNSYLYYYWNGFGVVARPSSANYGNSWMFRRTVASSYHTVSSSVIYWSESLAAGLERGNKINHEHSLWSNNSSIDNRGFIGIGNGGSYYVPGFGSVYFSDVVGDFPDNERYLGVRFYIGSERHYGWIRINMNRFINPLTIVDWAYETEPEKTILAGYDYSPELIAPELKFSGGGGTIISPVKTLTLQSDMPVFDLTPGDFIVTNGWVSKVENPVEKRIFYVEVTAFTEGTVHITLPAGAVHSELGIENEEISTSWEYAVPFAIDENEDSRISVFPNPAGDLLNIELPVISDIKLMSLNGDVVLKEQSVLVKSFDISHLIPGIYVLQITNNGNHLYHKVVKN